MLNKIRKSDRAVWLAEAPQTAYPPLEADGSADVVVVGGGITGLSVAYLLQRDGVQVALVEAESVGCGITGMSTAKVTTLHQKKYSDLEKKFDEKGARTYAEANQAGLDWMAQFAERSRDYDIDCRWERQSAYTYTSDGGRVDEIRAEVEAASRAGLAATFTTETELPFGVNGAVRVENQAQFDPYKYCVALARAFEREGGRILERTRVHKIETEDGGDVVRVQTKGSELRAQHVVQATLLPVIDHGGYFARTYPSRSYGISAELEGPVPQGMYICIEKPTRSVRPLPDGRGIVVVGEEHKVGQDDDTRERYAALESWARHWFNVRAITHRWSAQDYMSADSVPFVGQMPGTHGRVWTATGFSKWGLTTGTAAALILADLIQGRENAWAKFFDATRVDILPSAKKFISENADVAKRFVGDRLRALAADGIDELARGDAAIVEYDGDKVAAYRDESGVIHACSPICTHMGCHVQWNTAEKSWDCPCHGSRFDYEGNVLQGPAVEPLGAKEVGVARRAAK